MIRAEEIAPSYGVHETCDAMGLSTATFYRRRQRAAAPPRPAARVPPRKLTSAEEQKVLDALNSQRFMDQAVPEVYATLLDEGSYLCSPRTMYRILNRHQLVQERRHERQHPVYQKPELLATGPNQVWSWDITKIKGPKPWIFYNLYVVLDVFSRYVVGWTLCDHESGEQARVLLEGCYKRECVGPGQLKVHSDRGKAMRSKCLADLLADLQVSRSFSRPHVSNDNPYSESQFKTLKYHSTFPERFGSIEDARSYLRAFFQWYNTQHRHSGLALMTPEVVHSKQDQQVWMRRKQILTQAYQQHPERFVKGHPEPQNVPDQVWINPPKKDAA
jgi:putative transposase